MRKWWLLIVTLLLSVSALGVYAQTDDVAENPGAYVGQEVTVEGVANIISNNVVELIPLNPDVTPANILVVPYPNDQYGIDINNGMRIRATGTIYNYNVAEVESAIGYPLDESLLTNYNEQDVVLVATDVTQVGGPRTSTGDVTVSEFEANPETYYDGILTVEGVTNILSNNVVELTQTQPFDLSPDSLLMVPGSDGEFSIDVNNGQRVRVTGRFASADEGTLESDLGYDLDDTTFSAYTTEDHVIVAEDITLLSAADTAVGANELRSLTTDPSTYYGQAVTASGYIAESVDQAAGSFVIRTDDLLNSNRALVLLTTDAQSMMGELATSSLAVQDRVVVTGTVRQASMADLESELGYTLDDTTYANYTNLPVIVANSVEFAAENDPVTTLGTDANMANTGTFDASVYDDYPEANASLDDVIDNPSAYYGQIVTVTGTVSNDFIGTGRGFYIWDDDLIDSDRALILGASQATWDTMGLLDTNTEVAVRGVVRAFNIVDLENELGYDLNDGDYVGVNEGIPAIVALEIIPGVSD